MSKSRTIYDKIWDDHLVNTNEILASTLLTWHNIAFYQDLMSKIRYNISIKNFDNFYKKNFKILNN